MSNEDWLEKDAQRLAQAEERRGRERIARREEWTKRIVAVGITVPVVSGLCFVIALAFHHHQIPDPNPTCDVAKLHLLPGETVTLNCPANLSGHNTPLTPAR